MQVQQNARAVAVGYVRTSTEEQILGPEAQRAALAAWAVRTGAELVAVHDDRGVSGAAPLDKRPGLLAALADLKAKRAGVLIVAKRDRLARDPILAALVERMAERAGARVVSADGVGDGDGPEAQLMKRIIDAVAEYERALIKARTRAALAAKRAKGERTGTVPFGYLVAADGASLEPDEAEAAIVAAVLELRGAGLSVRGVAAELEARGLCNRVGRPVAPTQVARIIKRGRVIFREGG